MHQVLNGDCIEVLRGLPDNSVDSIVTDPPYGLAFMGKRWDYDVPGEDVWRECLRVLKPGGHLLAFAGTRTQHRMAVRIEDAGFEIRDMIMWVYGSGFPKSHDVSKAIDKAAGHDRATDYKPNYKNGTFGNGMGGGKHGAQAEPPVTDSARQWDGWGSALKPATEPITVARKPLQGTLAANVLQWGTGGLNIDACRVGDEVVGWGGGSDDPTQSMGRNYRMAAGEPRPDIGRWPANLAHDGSAEAADGLVHAARYFYTAKASRRERDAGLDGMPQKRVAMLNAMGDDPPDDIDPVSARFTTKPARNHHPTVKPVTLMRWLCRLVTPPGGVVLDPFAGSGSTGVAAAVEGFGSILIEREAEYVEIIRRRLAHAQGEMFVGA